MQIHKECYVVDRSSDQTTREQSPIIICGSHGGGTSYVVKLLRFAGFFAGADSGDIRDRKFHESLCYKKINRALGEKFGDRDVLTKSSIAGVERELTTELDRWVSEVNEKRNELEHRFGIARNRTPLNAALAMLRWVNRLVPRSRHTWTGYVCGNRGYRSTRAPWGWKDPRNSITLPLWQAIYPDARVLVIRKEVDKTEAKSSSGEWFRDPNNRELIDRYRSPSFVGPRDRIKFVSVEDLTGDARHFNDLLVWIGLPTLTERQFRGLLEVTHFESATAAHRNPATSNVTAAAAATSVADGVLREDFVIWLTQFQCF